MEHALKTWPDHFAAVKAGDKRAELRADDRQPPFAAGDNLVLQEFEPGRGLYTGRTLLVRITHVARGGVVPAGHALLSVRRQGWF